MESPLAYRAFGRSSAPQSANTEGRPCRTNSYTLELESILLWSSCRVDTATSSNKRMRQPTMKMTMAGLMITCTLLLLPGAQSVAIGTGTQQCKANPDGRVSDASCRIEKPTGSYVTELTPSTPNVYKSFRLFCQLPIGSDVTNCSFTFTRGAYTINPTTTGPGISTLNVTSLDLSSKKPYRWIFTSSRHDVDYEIQYIVQPYPLPFSEARDDSVNVEQAMTLKSCKAMDCLSDWCRDEQCCVTVADSPKLGWIRGTYITNSSIRVDYNVSRIGAYPTWTQFMLLVQYSKSNSTILPSVSEIANIHYYKVQPATSSAGKPDDTANQIIEYIKVIGGIGVQSSSRAASIYVDPKKKHLDLFGMPPGHIFDLALRSKEYFQGRSCKGASMTNDIYKKVVSADKFCTGLSDDNRRWSTSTCSACPHQTLNRTLENVSCVQYPAQLIGVVETCTCINGPAPDASYCSVQYQLPNCSHTFPPNSPSSGPWDTIEIWLPSAIVTLTMLIVTVVICCRKGKEGRILEKAVVREKEVEIPGQKSAKVFLTGAPGCKKHIKNMELFFEQSQRTFQAALQQKTIDHGEFALFVAFSHKELCTALTVNFPNGDVDKQHFLLSLMEQSSCGDINRDLIAVSLVGSEDSTTPLSERDFRKFCDCKHTSIPFGPKPVHEQYQARLAALLGKVEPTMDLGYIEGLVNYSLTPIQLSTEGSGVASILLLHAHKMRYRRHYDNIRTFASHHLIPRLKDWEDARRYNGLSTDDRFELFIAVLSKELLKELHDALLGPVGVDQHGTSTALYEFFLQRRKQPTLKSAIMCVMFDGCDGDETHPATRDEIRQYSSVPDELLFTVSDVATATDDVVENMFAAASHMAIIEPGCVCSWPPSAVQPNTAATHLRRHDGHMPVAMGDRAAGSEQLSQENTTGSDDNVTTAPPATAGVATTTAGVATTTASVVMHTTTTASRAPSLVHDNQRVPPPTYTEQSGTLLPADGSGRPPLDSQDLDEMIAHRSVTSRLGGCAAVPPPYHRSGSEHDDSQSVTSTEV